MADPTDEKFKAGLPTYVPLPQDEHQDALPDTAPTRRSGCCRKVLRHAIVLFVAGLWLFYFLKKGGNGIKNLAYHEYNDADYFGVSSIFGDEPHRRPCPSQCQKWSNKSSIEDSTFKYSFPTNSSALHFSARGHFVGTVDYVFADSSAAGDSIDVSVTLGATGLYVGGSSKLEKHSSWAKLRPSWWPCKNRHPRKPRAKICLLHEHGSQSPSGFAILTPPYHKGLRWRWFGRHGPPRLPAPPKTPDHPQREAPHPHPHALPVAPRPHHRAPYSPAAPPFWDRADSHHHPVQKHDDEHLNHDEDEEHTHHPHYPHHHHHHHCHDGKGHKGCKKFYKRPVPVVYAKVTITIPRGALELPELHSVFPGLKQRVGDVFDDVTFGNVTLVGKGVAVDTVTGDNAVVVAHGGEPINGSFTVTERLSIVGGDSPVDVNVTMFSSAHAEKPTVLDIVNNKAPITTIISLRLNSTANERGGFFAISQVNKQSDITSNVTSQPLDSIVRFAAVTKDANVTATFPPAYEGRFSLVASRHGRSFVEADTDVEDPSGEGRKRYLEVKEYFGSIITGFVGWRGGSITEDYFRGKVKDMWSHADDGYGDETTEIVDPWEGAVVREVPHEETVDPPSFSEDGEGAESYPPTISLVTSTGTNRLYFV